MKKILCLVLVMFFSFIAMAPITEAYIGNPRSKKLHSDDCVYGKRARRQVYFDDLDTALHEGYTKCRMCASAIDAQENRRQIEIYKRKAAEKKRNSLSLGGINPIGMRFNDVVRIYGQPNTVEDSTETYSHRGKNYSFATKTYGYGNSFFVEVTDDGRIMHLKTTANNGISMSKGIHVKSPLKDLKNAYSDWIKKEDDKHYCWQEYYGNDIYTMSCEVQKNIITEIEIVSRIEQ